MKRILAFLLTFLLLLQVIPVAFAEGSEAVMTIASASAERGQEVTLTVSVTNCTDAKTILLAPEYDDSVLEIIRGEWLIHGTISDNWSEEFGSAVLTFNSVTDINTNIFQWVFKVKDDAPIGAVAKVGFEEVIVKTMEGSQEVPVQVSVVEGSVTVVAGECFHTEKTEVPSQSADCIHSGNSLYYTCDSCGQAFKADGVTETTIEAETIAPLGHDLSDATCTSPKTCKVCGATEGEALGHSFTNYVPNNDATCTADGTKTATCDRCDETDTVADAGNAKGHDYTDATCTAPKTCKVCGATEGSALGHSFTNYVSNNDATCTDDGTKTATCDRCDEISTVTDAGSAKDHDYTDATCTAPKTCKVCGATEGEALGHSYGTDWSKGEDGHWHECSACGDKADFAEHDYGTEGDTCIACEYARSHIHRLTLVPGTDATCTTDGNKAYYSCSGCEDWFEDASGSVVISDKSSVIIPAPGHDMTEATCTAPKTCKVCGATEGEALGHCFTNYVSNNDATCTADGTKTATCDRCDETDTVADTGSAKGHDYADATCTAPETCKVCGATEGVALGHCFTNYVSNNDATCTADGTKTATCDRCDETDTVADTGSAKGHDYVYATCTAPKTCKVCGATEGEALGHSYGTDWSKGEDGHWHECSACGDKADFAEHDYGTEGDTCIACEYERSHIHRLTLVPGVDATCTTDGSKAYYTCSGCEDWFEDASGSVVIPDKSTVIIPTPGHDMTEATCTAPKTCKVCGATEGVALGHSFTNYVSNNDATCTADGTKTATCDRCDETDTVADAGSAKGHDYADATCTAPKTCKVCGATEGEALGHSYGTDWSKGEDGHWHECSACGDKADFAEHDYGTEGDTCIVCEHERSHVHRLTLVPGVDATCTTNGSKAYYICSGCEDWFEDASGSVVISNKSTVIIPAPGHDMTEATCTDPKTCKVCGATEGSALGHNYEDGWTSNGEKHWHKCSRCDAKTGEAEHTPGAEATEETAQTCTVCGYEIAPALGHTHKLTKVDATVTCTKAGNIAYYTCACGKWFADADATIEITDKNSVKSKALGHTDANNDNRCDVCGANLKNNQPTDGIPKTGDNSRIALWTVLLILSFVGVALCTIFYRKRKQD